MEKTTLLAPSLYGGRFTRAQFWKYYFAGFFALVLLGFVLGDVYPFFVSVLYTVFLIYMFNYSCLIRIFGPFINP